MSQPLTATVAAKYANTANFAHFAFDEWTSTVHSVHVFKDGLAAVTTWKVSFVARFIEWAEAEGVELVDIFSGPAWDEFA